MGKKVREMTRKISLEEGLELAINQWKWYREHPCKKKHAFFEDNNIKERPLHDCYLCQALRIEEDNDDVWIDCDKCPFAIYKNERTSAYFCEILDSPYRVWLTSRNFEESRKEADAVVQMLIDFKEGQNEKGI